MREAVQRLLVLSEMPDDSVDDEVLQAFDVAVASLAPPATESEARALLSVLPRHEDSLFGLAWGVLHFIESAPGWPYADELDDRGWWVQLLRVRVENVRADGHSGQYRTPNRRQPVGSRAQADPAPRLAALLD